MSVFSKAIGIDPLIAAMRARDLKAILLALKALYARYVNDGATAPAGTRGEPVKKQTFAEWVDETVAGMDYSK